MKSIVAMILLLQLNAAQKTEIVAAANKYVSGVAWQQDSIISGDFTCAGHKEQAILRIRRTETIVAIFLNGTSKEPQIIQESRYDASAVKLKLEALDYDPNTIIDVGPEGFQKSKTCMGMTIGDGNRDAVHVYWNHKSRKLDSWSL